MKIQRIVENLVMKHSKAILLFFLVLTVGSALLLPKLTRDPSPWLLEETHPARVNLETLRENYTGAGNSILVLLEAEDTVFNPDTLSRIQKLTTAFESLQILTNKNIEDLEMMAGELGGETGSILESIIHNHFNEDALEELDSVRELLGPNGQNISRHLALLEIICERLAPVIEVTSLANTDNILGTDDGLDVNPIYEEVPKLKNELLEMREKVWSNELFRRVLVTEDNRFTGIYIEIVTKDEAAEDQLLLYESIKNILEIKIPGDEKHYIAGSPSATAMIGKTMETDSNRLFPVVIILVMACLWFTFRMYKGIMVPMAVVILSVVVTLALKVLFNIPINIITSALPIFIISIGVADGIHIFSEYRDHLMEGMNKRDAVRRTIQNLTMPVILTSITTAGAFWSLSITEIIKIKHFGLFVAAGTLIAMVFSLLFIPALLTVLPQSEKIRKKRESKLDQYFARGLESLSMVVIKKPVPVLLLFSVIISAAIYGTFQVKVDNNFVKYLMPDSDIVISTDKLNKEAAGSLTLNLLIDSSRSEAEPLKNPENLKAISNLTHVLDQHRLVGKTLGLTRLIERLNFVLHNEDPAFNRIPNTVETIEDSTDPGKKPVRVSGRNMISQLLLLYENSGGDTLSDVVDSEYKHANLPLILRTNSSMEIAELVDDIRAYTRVNFPEDLKVDFGGSAYVEVASTMEIVTGQVKSLVISFLLVFLMLVYLFRSIQKGLLAMIPLTTTILINFGVMGFFGVPLDVGTALVSSIVIGIGVDYSIHYMSRLQESIRNGKTFKEGIQYTVKHSGRAITANSFTVGIGFTALLVSIFTPLVTMGWMITMTMIVSAAATIVLLPAVLSLVQKGFVRKTVTGLRKIEGPMIHSKKKYAS